MSPVGSYITHVTPRRARRGEGQCTGVCSPPASGGLCLKALGAAPCPDEDSWGLPGLSGGVYPSCCSHSSSWGRSWEQARMEMEYPFCRLWGCLLTWKRGLTLVSGPVGGRNVRSLHRPLGEQLSACPQAWHESPAPTPSLRGDSGGPLEALGEVAMCLGPWPSTRWEGWWAPRGVPGHS